MWRNKRLLQLRGLVCVSWHILTCTHLFLDSYSRSLNFISCAHKTRQNIKSVYTKVYLIRLLVLPQLFITVLWRNDNSSLGLHMMETRASGMTGKPPVTTVVHQPHCRLCLAGTLNNIISVRELVAIAICYFFYFGLTCCFHGCGSSLANINILCI